MREQSDGCSDVESKVADAFVVLRDLTRDARVSAPIQSRSSLGGPAKTTVEAADDFGEGRRSDGVHAQTRALL